MRAGRETSLDALDWPSIVRAGDMVAWGQASAEPAGLTRTLLQARHEIGAFRVFAGISYGESVSPEHTDTVAYTSYCGTGQNRKLGDNLDILPVHYAQLASTLERRAGGDLVVLISLAPGADEDHFSFGAGADYLADLLASARTVIAEVSSATPRTGPGKDLHRSQIDYIVRTGSSLLAPESATVGEVETRIAGHVAGLIRNGSVLQIGLGTLPAAVLKALMHHKDLGIHSGLITEDVAQLCEAGVITNARKTIDTGSTVTGLISGGKDLMAWADGNRQLLLRPSSYTHNSDVLAQIDNFVAINSAIEVDLTGQVNAELAGGRYVGAVGGAGNFLRGAARSEGGMGIIALPSTARGNSRIVRSLSGPVTTPRSDVGFVVTEHGIADLRDATLAEREVRLLDLVAPEHRDVLAR